MGLLYPNEDKETIFCEVSGLSDLVLGFTSNNGKHGTIEDLDEIEISANDLLSILQKRDTPRTEIGNLRDEVKEGKFHIKGYSESGHKQFLEYPDLISKFVSRLTKILGDK